MCLERSTESRGRKRSVTPPKRSQSVSSFSKKRDSLPGKPVSNLIESTKNKLAPTFTKQSSQQQDVIIKAVSNGLKKQTRAKVSQISKQKEGLRSQSMLDLALHSIGVKPSAVVNSNPGTNFSSQKKLVNVSKLKSSRAIAIQGNSVKQNSNSNPLSLKSSHVVSHKNLKVASRNDQVIAVSNKALVARTSNKSH